MHSLRLIGAACIGLSFTSACSSQHTDGFAGVLNLTSLNPDAGAVQITATNGWAGVVLPDAGVQDIKIEYYDLGTVQGEQNKDMKVVDAPTAFMYWFYDDAGQPLFHLATDGAGNPLRDDSLLVSLDEPDHPCNAPRTTLPPGAPCDAPRVQHPIIDTIPGRPDYTPFFQVLKVTVPKGYALDAIKSRETLDSSGLKVEPTGIALNCPVVDETTTLVPGVAGRNRLYGRLTVWFRRMQGTCLLVEGGEQLFPWNGNPMASTTPPFAVIHAAIPEHGATREVLQLFPREAYVPTWTHKVGMMTIETVAVPENLIVLQLPGDPDYSPFVRFNTVTVGAAYTQGYYKDYQTLDPTLIEQTDTYHDLPLRGAVPPCNTQDDCTKLGLSCDLLSHFCQPPPVGLGEDCGPGIATCKLDKVPGVLPDGLTCWKRRDNKHGNCYMGCDPTAADGDPAQDVDTRCLSVRGLQCIGAFTFGCPNGDGRNCPYSNHGGVCEKTCNKAIDDPNTAPLGGSTQCTTDDISQRGGTRVNFTAGQVCVQTAIEACSWTDDFRQPH